MKRIKIDNADKLFSRYIRERDKWTCQKCMKPHEVNSGGLHCAHFYTRRNESTRFDPDNADSLCAGCHLYFDGHPLVFAKWKFKRLGQDRMNQLTIRTHTLVKKDRKMMAIKIKALLAELKRGE